jgi:uncharacterized phage protein (TIGR01671 family)
MKKNKFRAWIKSCKKYVYINGFVYGNTDIRIWWQESSDHFYNQSFNPKEIELEQYTGMEDSKGTDIYKGDVVIVRLADGESGMGVIDFVDGCFDILFLGLAYIDGKFRRRDYLKCWTINHAVTVIGNIHNKEGGE